MQKRSKVNLIDLAGSERTGAIGNKGIVFEEGASINKSLTVLGRCIKVCARARTCLIVFATVHVRLPTPPSAHRFLGSGKDQAERKREQEHLCAFPRVGADVVPPRVAGGKRQNHNAREH